MRNSWSDRFRSKCWNVRKLFVDSFKTILIFIDWWPICLYDLEIELFEFQDKNFKFKQEQCKIKECKINLNRILDPKIVLRASEILRARDATFFNSIWLRTEFDLRKTYSKSQNSLWFSDSKILETANSKCKNKLKRLQNKFCN